MQLPPTEIENKFLLFQICHQNMKILFFLKSRITVAVIIRRTFLFCVFKRIEDWDCHLSIWRQGGTQACASCWSWMKAVVPERDAGPVSAVCVCNGWHGTCTHSQYVSPGKGNSTTACSWAQPASHKWEEEHPGQGRAQGKAWLIWATRWSKDQVLWNGNTVLLG